MHYYFVGWRNESMEATRRTDVVHLHPAVRAWTWGQIETVGLLAKRKTDMMLSGEKWWVDHLTVVSQVYPVEGLG